MDTQYINTFIQLNPPGPLQISSGAVGAMMNQKGSFTEVSYFFTEIVLKKLFAIKCCETILYTSMN